MARARRGLRAWTLVELLVALAVGTVFLTLLFVLWRTTTRYAVTVEARLTRLQQAQLALATITREIHQAQRIAAPAPDTASSGLVILGPDGEAVQFAHQSPAAGEKSGRIMRHRLGASPKSEVVLEQVFDLKVQIPAAPRGREPSLVNLTLTLEGPGGKPVYLFASARVRGISAVCPLDR